MLSYKLFNTHSQNNNTASDELSPNHFHISLLQNNHFSGFFLASNIIFRLIKTSNLNIRFFFQNEQIHSIFTV